MHRQFIGSAVPAVVLPTTLANLRYTTPDLHRELVAAHFLGNYAANGASSGADKETTGGNQIIGQLDIGDCYGKDFGEQSLEAVQPTLNDSGRRLLILSPRSHEFEAVRHQ
jgi:hypothetical protein